MVGGVKIGNRCCPRASPKELPGNHLHFSSSSTTYPFPPPTTPGDIEVFNGMQIKELNLFQCGVGGEASGQRPKNLPRNLLHLVKMFRNIIAHTANTSSPFAGKDKAKKMFPNAKVKV